VADSVERKVTAAVAVRVLDRSRIAEIRPAWLSLLPESRWKLFSHPDWFMVTQETFFPSAQVRFHVAYRGEKIVGILPICQRRMNRFGLFLPVTEVFLGNRNDYNLVVAGTDPDLEIARALIVSALRSARSSGTLVFANVPVETGLPRLLDTVLAEQGQPYRRSEAPTRLLTLPTAFAEAEAGLKKSLRNDLRRQEKRLAEAFGPLRFRVIADPHEATELLPAFFDMHDRRWLALGMPGSFADPSTRQFYIRLIRDLWSHGIHFSTLSAGSRTVAYHLGMKGSDYMLYYKPTFDTDLQKFSPGKLHLKYLIEHAIDSGITWIDFLQGSESYKSDWTSKITLCESFVIRTRAFSPSYSWLTVGRPQTERVAGLLYNRIAALLQRSRARSYQ
jgi:CelD/BcsL family acetyltransferase involved in cellulose biosynthesis